MALMWLHVLVCQACINIPQTDSDSSLYVSTLFSPPSCLGNQQYLWVKILMGSYLIFFHPVFHLQIIGYLRSQQVKTLYPLLSYAASSLLDFLDLSLSRQPSPESLKCPFGKGAQLSMHSVHLFGGNTTAPGRLHFTQKIRTILD